MQTDHCLCYSLTSLYSIIMYLATGSQLESVAKQACWSLTWLQIPKTGYRLIGTLHGRKSQRQVSCLWDLRPGKASTSLLTEVFQLRGPYGTFTFSKQLTFQLDHLQARYMHTQATIVCLYCKQNVVKCRLKKVKYL